MNLREERIEHFLVVLFLEELDDGVRHDRSDATDGGQLPMRFRRRIGGGFRRLAQCFECPEMTCQEPCRRLAHMRNAERVDESIDCEWCAALRWQQTGS